jgi:hypothetical protein
VVRVLSPSRAFNAFVVLYQSLHVHARRVAQFVLFIEARKQLQAEKISEKYFWDFLAKNIFVGR